MPPRLSLKGFLRRDLLSRRTRALIPYHDEHNASRRKLGFKLDPAAPDLPLPPRPATPMSGNGEAAPARDVDSLFGEPIYTKEEVRQEKIQQLLAEGRKHEQDVRPRSQNPELVKLMDELNALVSRELEASGEEKKLIRSQKLALIKETGKVEARIKGKKVKRCKVPADEEAILPEPISPPEKKELRIMQERVAKAVLGIEGRCSGQKRKRKGEDDIYEMDGEDRLRAGITKVPKELRPTGRWYSRIHDYFPEPENGVDGAGVLEDLTPEERMTLRRELAEYGEQLAKTARKIKEAEKKAEQLKGGKYWYRK